MRFNLISENSDGFGFTQRLLSEGHSVRMFIKDRDANEVGDGLVEKIGDFNDFLDDFQDEGEEDTFLFDSSGMGVHADFLRNRGMYVLGGSVIADKMEHDRKYAMQLMSRSGIKIPPTASFKDWDSARDYVEEHEERLVFKPSKKLGELANSHVSFDKEDMLDYLENAHEASGDDNPEFDLQDFVDGVEVSTECWFSGGAFLPMFNHTLEHKQLMNDNKGPSGGCVGNVVWSCSGFCPICEATVQKLGSFLRREKYNGPLDVNSIVTENGVFGLEFTPRFGYDAAPTLVWTLLNVPFGEFISLVAREEAFVYKDLLKQETYGSAVRVTIPPWPTEKFHAASNIPIGGLEPNHGDYIYLYNVKASPSREEKEREAKLVSAGAWGILLLVCGSGGTIKEAFKKPYKTLEKLRIPDAQYRTDLAVSFSSRLASLESLLETMEVAP